MNHRFVLAFALASTACPTVPTVPLPTTDDTGAPTTLPEDADDDGFRAEAVGGDDCDDTDPAVHPGANEIPYDGIDQDCDGEDLVDVDQDGVAAVEAGGGDCDDTDPDVAPGRPEVCLDGKDNDCDGTANQCALSGQIELGEGHALITGEQPDEFLGRAIAAADLDGDGIADLLARTAFEDAGEPVGRVRGFLGGPSGLGPRASSAADATWVAAGETLELLPTGRPLSGLGDVDGDGFEDFGVVRRVFGETFQGLGLRLVHGGPGLTSTPVSLGSQPLLDGIVGWLPRLHPAGDVNDDGYDDFLIGQVYVLPEPTLLLVLGGPTRMSGGTLPTANVVQFTPAEYGALLTGVGVGDLDGDGFDDIAIGEAAYHNQRGAVHIVYGGPFVPGGTVALETAGLPVIEGQGAADLAGTHVYGAGDVDGDGFDDLWIETESADAVALVRGGAARLEGAGTIDQVAPAARITGGGLAAATGADLDGDATPDLVMTGSNAVYVFYSPPPSGATVDDADATLLTDRYDFAGLSDDVLAADFDGDGYNELVLGARGYSGSGVSGGGAVYVLHGSGL